MRTWVEQKQSRVTDQFQVEKIKNYSSRRGWTPTHPIIVDNILVHFLLSLGKMIASSEFVYSQIYTTGCTRRRQVSHKIFFFSLSVSGVN